MTNQEYSSLIKAQGLLPIRIQGEAEDELPHNHVVIGSIETFFEAARALEAKVVFIYSSTLTEDDFKFITDYEEFGEDTDDSEDDEETQIEYDLTEVDPALEKYRKFIGTEFAVLLVAKGGHEDLAFYQEAAWKKEFDLAYEEAVEQIDEEE